MPGRHLVLLVDDSDSFRDRVERELTGEGYDILTASSGEAALEVVRDIRPDAVVSDLEMPGIDGLSLCRTLRELRAFDPVPLVICTHAPADDPRVQAARILVGTSVVHKPVDGFELAAVIDDLLGVPGVVLAGERQMRSIPGRRATADGSSGLLARISAQQ